MAIILDKKLVLTSDTKINTYGTGAQNMDEVEVYLINDGDKTINHSVYPNGLVIQVHQYVDKIILYSNRDFGKQADGVYVVVNLQ